MMDTTNNADEQRVSDPSQFSHFLHSLTVLLKEGRNLAIRDSCGTSDPYVKFKLGKKLVYKSRTVFKNLNPKWNERFTVPLEDLSQPIRVSVKDYDWGLVRDDPMGDAIILPSRLQENVPQEMTLTLSDEKKGGKSAKETDLGCIVVECMLIAVSFDDKLDTDTYFRRITRPTNSTDSKKLRVQQWSSVVTIVLIEGRNLIAMDDNGYSDPYIKFKMGNERYKSKYKAKTLNPRWVEQFDLYMYDDQSKHLELSVFDHDVGGRDDIMGRVELDLSGLEKERTHNIELRLEDGAGLIHLLISICDALPHDSAMSDISSPKRDDIVRKYGVLNSFSNFKDVGVLKVKVLKAQGLAGVDLGGTSDPFCVLELVNTRLQTHAEYKTLAPAWGKVFTFDVYDIHSVLEVTVYDANRDKKVEFLGKVSIPLLRITRGDSIRTYQLKDKNLLCRVKGTVSLELSVDFNHFKAAIRTVNPREVKYMQQEAKFKIACMKNNIDRVSKIIDAVLQTGRFIQSCFNWDSKIRSSLAFAAFLILVWNVELYMLPVTLLIIFLKNWTIVRFMAPKISDDVEFVAMDEEDDDDDKDPKKQEEKKNQSIREKLASIQEVLLQVQEGMDMTASMGERIKNAFDWVVPWLSMLAVIALTVAAFILYYVPLRYIVMIWGINKFTKKLRSPNAIQNNELLDYLSRVPSDRELVEYRELRPETATGSIIKRRR